ncbi:MAG: hypothetical protein AB7S36_11420 [Planctomycetota bacterium]
MLPHIRPPIDTPGFSTRTTHQVLRRLGFRGLTILASTGIDV